MKQITINELEITEACLKVSGELLMALQNECFAETGERLWSLEDAQNFLSMPGILLLFATYRRKPIGYCLYLCAVDQAELLSFGVLPYVKNQKLGRFLLKKSYDWLINRAIKSVFLEVQETNKAAQAVYSHLNFEQVGVRKDYYSKKDGSRVDGIVYRLVLSDPKQ